MEELQALLARYGARDDADLIKKQVAWKALEQEVTRLGREITALLAPFKSAEALRATLADRTKALTVSCHEIGIALDEVPALEPPDEHALQAAYDAALKEEETQHALLDDLQKHYERCRKTEADLVNGKAEALRALEREHSIIHTILSSRGCSNLDALRTAVEASAASLREVRDAYNTAQADLPDPSVDPERLLVTARDALAEMEARISDLRDQRTRAIASIEQAQVEGRYEKLAAAEEELSGLQTEYARVSREARAVALLRTLLNERRRDAVSGQLPGLAEAVSRMMQAIMQRPRSITLTDAFNVARVQEEGVETPYLADALSAGAREQLDLVLRIALGEAYAGEYGRAMLVLDDALLYTDPARHDRIKEILKIAADRLQIFILTSHADRYRGITAPEYQFDLMKLRAQSVARV
ncbi:MAG: hypothetical protein BWY76_01193 [bacterium ADurb.Bin429]|nr:MAG: hypothetical protein BWY76_01193 [bacterium ADurb.Bin429]